DITERKKMEEELRESEEKYRSLIETMNDGLFILDNNQVITFINNRFCKMLDYSEKELLGKEINTLIQEEYRSVVEGMKLGRKEKIEQYELRFLNKNGSIIHTILSPNSMYKGGKFIGSVCVVTDITEKKEAEEILRESEKRFRRLFEDAAIGINLTNLEGRITASNTALQNMLGYNFDELNRMNFTDFTYQEDIEVDMKLFEEMIEGKRDSYMLEKRYTKRNKEVIWVNITVTIIRDEQKNPLYAISMVEDISVRKNAVMDLKESEEKNRQLINNANDAIFITSLNEEGELSFLISVNEKACALLGYTEEELLSLTPRDILSLDDIANLDESLRVLLDGKGFVTERIFLTKEGKGIPVEISSHLIELRDQPVTMAIARDISERKQSETIQRMAYSQIERNIQELANLVDGIRNPLAVIQGCIEVKYPGYDDVISKQLDLISSTTNEISDRWLESEQFRNILREQFIV
ncbi:MAG: PAS domain S-box protein, partial [Candidatus Heimdallarchaeota archaeon]|nr:PAS domain S-box protein [Candidatus Heimdallarchaeota archaeon]MCK4876181.1 PAS domain S-box protein [Candidatus Heimdallarchaeota archaeon]